MTIDYAYAIVILDTEKIRCIILDRDLAEQYLDSHFKSPSGTYSGRIDRYPVRHSV